MLLEFKKFKGYGTSNLGTRPEVFCLIKDHLNLFLIFYEGIESKYQSKLNTIIARIELFSNQQPMPPNKFRCLNPKQKGIKEYEFKNDDLRVYAFKLKSMFVIAFGGYKNNQSNDIIKLKSITKQLSNGK